MNSVNLSLESFQGPLDLLIHLIDKNEVDIYDIPIAELTDQYIDYIKSFTEKNMESMSEFVLMAATLIEIKSKMLLPKAYDEQAGDEEDPRAALVERLIEYKRFKSVISDLKDREEKAEKVFFKEYDRSIENLIGYEPEIDFEELLGGLTSDELYKAFQDVISRRELKTDKVRSSFKSVVKDLYTVEEKIEYIENLLLLYPSVKFNSIFSYNSSRIEKIVTFLALLELIKVKKVYISQKGIFGEILIQSWRT